MALEEEDEDIAIPEWVVTFGDMMSLLLTFFIMLVSLSEIKQDEQYQALVESIRQQFGHDSSISSMMPGTSKPRNSAIAKMATMGRAKRHDVMRGGDKVKAPVGDHPRVRIVRPGTRTIVGSVIPFDEGSIVLTQQHKLDLRILAGELGGKPQKIEIRGHTSGSPLPSDAPYADHWDLAYRRAKSVAAFLIEDLGIDPRRVRISVAGPHEPYTLAVDPEMQKLNPRVEAYLLDEVSRSLSGSPGELDERFSTDEVAPSTLESPPAAGESAEPTRASEAATSP